MEQEFVPYQLAMKLKELGFDEPCLFAFDNCSTPMRCTDLRTNDEKFNGVNYNSSSYTSHPTFSQVFRWFREKYDLFHSIDTRVSKDIGYLILLNDEEIHIDSCFWNYEEAELACLKKLIEIVESKSE